MTKLQKTTCIFLAIYVAVGVGYDIWAAAQGGAPGTISWMITWISQQWWGASIVFALGFLMGHFFAQDGPVKLTGWVKKKFQ